MDSDTILGGPKDQIRGRIILKKKSDSPMSTTEFPFLLHRSGLAFTGFLQRKSPPFIRFENNRTSIKGSIGTLMEEQSIRARSGFRIKLYNVERQQECRWTTLEEDGMTLFNLLQIGRSRTRES